LNPQKELPLNFPIQTVQPMYYVADSFKHAVEVLIQFGEGLNRPFQIWYNEANNTIECSRNIKTRASEEKDMFAAI